MINYNERDMEYRIYFLVYRENQSYAFFNIPFKIGNM